MLDWWIVQVASMYQSIDQWEEIGTSSFSFFGYVVPRYSRCIDLFDLDFIVDTNILSGILRDSSLGKKKHVLIGIYKINTNRELIRSEFEL